MPRYLNILLLSMATLAALATTACSGSGDEPLPVPDAIEYHAGFYVTVGDEAPTQSRTPQGDYDPGAGLENFIDLEGGDIRVVLYRPDGSFLTRLTDFTVTPVADYSSSKRYYFNGSTTTDISDGKFKIMILANWGEENYPDDLSLKNVWAQQFTFKSPVLSNSNKKEERNLIPLFGIKDIAIADGIKPGVSANLGTIHLLRAFAKVEVNLVEAPKDWHVKSLQITHYNTAGFCAPTEADSQDDYVQGNWDDDYVKFGVSIPKGTTVKTDLDFVPAGTDKWIVYVPEYCNTMGNGEKARIAISFEESFVPHTDYIEFIHPRYKTEMDINRNYWYKFNITKKDETSDLIVVVDVKPYTVVDLDPGFGIPTDPNYPDNIYPDAKNQ